MSAANAFGFAAARVVTCDPERTDAPGVSASSRTAAVVVDGGRVAYVGPRAGAPPGVPTRGARRLRRDAGPGRRAHARLLGGLAARRVRGAHGGGRLSGHRAGGRRHPGDATAPSPRRPRTSWSRPWSGACGAWRSLGVTTVEVKSGYGLEGVAGAQAASRDRARGRAERRSRRRADVPRPSRLAARRDRAHRLRGPRGPRARARRSRARASRDSSTPTSTPTPSRPRKRASSATRRERQGSAYGSTSGSSPTWAARSWPRRSAPRRRITSSTCRPRASRRSRAPASPPCFFPSRASRSAKPPPPVARAARRGRAAGRRERREPRDRADREPSPRDGARRPRVRSLARRGDPRSHPSRGGRARPHRPGRASRRERARISSSGTSRTSTRSCSRGEFARRAGYSSKGGCCCRPRSLRLNERPTLAPLKIRAPGLAKCSPPAPTLA